MPGEPLERAVAGALAGPELLLVLDNFEHLLGAGGVVAELLAGAPGLDVLATSREPLRITGEHRLDVPPLPPGDARELFVQRALGLRPDLVQIPCSAQSEHDLPAGRGGTCHHHPASLDQEHAFGAVPLDEQRLATVKLAAVASLPQGAAQRIFGVWGWQRHSVPSKLASVGDAGGTGGSDAPPVATRMTMLFTDIEGSTRLARALGGAWPLLVDDHHRLLESAITARGGHVERTAGDSFFALFEDPVQAVRAAVDAQRLLADHRWPQPAGELRVRMGLHTGRVDRSERDLTGIDIHLAARIEAAANGGQVVISEATRDAVGGEFAIEALGLHRLKDFPAPERLFRSSPTDVALRHIRHFARRWCGRPTSQPSCAR